MRGSNTTTTASKDETQECQLCFNKFIKCDNRHVSKCCISKFINSYYPSCSFFSWPIFINFGFKLDYNINKANYKLYLFNFLRYFSTYMGRELSLYPSRICFTTSVYVLAFLKLGFSPNITFFVNGKKSTCYFTRILIVEMSHKEVKIEASLFTHKTTIKSFAIKIDNHIYNNLACVLFEPFDQLLFPDAFIANQLCVKKYYFCFDYKITFLKLFASFSFRYKPYNNFYYFYDDINTIVILDDIDCKLFDIIWYV